MQFEEFVHEVLAAGARPTSHVPAPSTDRLREVLADARRSGLAVSHAPDGPLVVAAPVCGPSGTVVAALALTVPDGIEPRSVAPVVRATSQRISRELAGSPAGLATVSITQ
jgi:DNA-binding IclR family transcriptional regulator